MAAASLGYPDQGGLFAPVGDADLRLIVYGPELSFSETAGLAAATLFPEDLDPMAALELSSKAFSEDPPTSPLGEDLFGMDLCCGPTRCDSDYSSRFVAALFDGRVDLHGKVALASVSGRELSSLVAAFASPQLPFVALCGEDGLAGLDPRLLARNGGSIHLAAVRGGPAAAEKLERGSAGLMIGPRQILPLGAGTPARFCGRALLLVSMLIKARRGIAGELYLAVPPDDAEAVATALWVWRWGLPFTGLIIPEPERGLLEGSRRNADDSRTGLYERFIVEHPSSSLLLRVPVSGSDLERLGSLPSPWDDSDDYLTRHALAASRLALDSGLDGHARIVLPRFTADLGALPRAGYSTLALCTPDFTTEADPAEFGVRLRRQMGL